MPVADLKLSQRTAFVCAALMLVLAGLFAFSANARAEGGTVLGWGFDAEAQLGNETLRNGPGECDCIPVPTPVKGASHATQIAAGALHALALNADGTVSAWGGSIFGQLGNGSREISVVPAAVPDLSGVIEIAAGEFHSLALLDNGTVAAWGSNVNGELGLGPDSFSICGAACGLEPRVVPGLDHVVAIAAGGFFDMALRADGTVFVWGDGERGEEFGDAQSSEEPGCIRCIAHPVRVPGISNAMAIAAGIGSAYALLPNGTVKAWGFNLHNALGTGVAPEAVGCECLGVVPVGGLSGASAISSGGFNGLARTSAGGIRGWGFDTHGELGDGNVNGGCGCRLGLVSPPGLSGAVEVASGFEYSLALLSDGTVSAWGNNFQGQAGNDSGNDHLAPTHVDGVSGASGVFAGSTSKTSFAIIGPSQTLKVQLTGTGKGSVGGPQGILCGPSSCENRFPQGQFETLRAESLDGQGFLGFSGSCSGTGPCRLKMSQDRTVVATFGKPTGTAITAAKIDQKKKTASFNFSAPGVITGFECELIRPARKVIRKVHGKRRVIRGKRPKASFAGCASTVTFSHLRPGPYSFKVRAFDSLGADPNPAVKKFTVKAARRPRGKRRHHLHKRA